MVDVGEVLDLALRQPGPRAEVAVVDALRRLPGVEVEEELTVVDSDRPDVRGRTVGEHDIRFEGSRVTLLRLPRPLPSCRVHGRNLPGRR